MKSFKQYVGDSKLPVLDLVMVAHTDGRVELYEGRNWIAGRFDKNIGIDQPTHGRGQQHAHVFGRKGGEIVVVNLDGTGSHGTKGRLHDDDAAALRARGFKVRDDNIIEWTVLSGGVQLLFG
jgi:hypothetical protein